MSRLSFEPIPYSLNWQVINGLPIEEERGAVSAVGDVLREAMPHRFSTYDAATKTTRQPPPFQSCKIDQGFGGVVLTTPTREIRFSLNHFFSKAVVQSLVELDQRVGDRPFDPVFYFYDDDWVRDDAVHHSCTFFVVNNREIVQETFRISAASGDFDNNVLEPTYGHEPIWAKDRAQTEAVTRWWYRKFYEQTEIGQFVALSDSRLFHYESPTHQHAMLLDSSHRLERHHRTTNRLLYVLCAAAIVSMLI